jgi:hypothetical protein
MFGSQVLEVVIGLTLIYLVLSIGCSGIKEVIAAMFSLRAKTLENGIRNMLKNGPNDFTAKLFAHPLILATAPEGQKPSYISARMFSAALFDIVAPADAAQPRTIQSLRAGVSQIPDAKLRTRLRGWRRRRSAAQSRALVRRHHGSRNWLVQTHGPKNHLRSRAVALRSGKRRHAHDRQRIVERPSASQRRGCASGETGPFYNFSRIHQRRGFSTSNRGRNTRCKYSAYRMVARRERHPTLAQWPRSWSFESSWNSPHVLRHRHGRAVLVRHAQQRHQFAVVGEPAGRARSRGFQQVAASESPRECTEIKSKKRTESGAHLMHRSPSFCLEHRLSRSTAEVYAVVLS